MTTALPNERLSLHWLGQDRDVAFEELEGELSLHTGRPLRRVRIWFRVPAEVLVDRPSRP